MAKGKAKSRFNFSINPKTGKSVGCENEKGTWSNLRKHKRCEHCMRCVDGSNACYVTAL